MPCPRQIPATTLLALTILAPQTIPGGDNTTPPIAPVRFVVNDYHGTKVTDPYPYMEQVLAWVPGRKALLARIEQLDASVPAVVNDVRRLPDNRVFYEKRLANHNRFKQYVRRGFAGSERRLVDPGSYAQTPGEHMALSWWEPSRNGCLVAFGLSPGGSEVAVLHVVDVPSGALLPDTIDRWHFGRVFWAADNHSFVYNRLQRMTPNAPPTDKYSNNRMYVHTLGADPEQDAVVFGAGVPGLVVAPTDVPTILLTSGSHYSIGFFITASKRQ